MLPFLSWKPIGEFFVSEIEGLNKFVYGCSEEDIQGRINKLGSDDYPVLVGVLPSSQSTSESMDNRTYDDICFFYVLVPIKDRTEEELDSAWGETQLAIQKVEHLIMDNYETSPLLRGIKPHSVHYDPEFGIWSCLGYSIGFSLGNDYIVPEINEG